MTNLTNPESFVSTLVPHGQILVLFTDRNGIERTGVYERSLIGSNNTQHWIIDDTEQKPYIVESKNIRPL